MIYELFKGKENIVASSSKMNVKKENSSTLKYMYNIYTIKMNCTSNMPLYTNMSQQ